MSSLSSIRRVIQSEGWASAARRAAARIEEALHLQQQLLRGRWTAPMPAPLLNVCPMPVTARYGGVPIQLRARLNEERRWREVALWQPGLLQIGTRAWRVTTLEDVLAHSGAHTLHLEGSSGLDLNQLLRTKARIILSLHDLDLLRQPVDLRNELLARAHTVIFPSAFLQNAYGIDGHIIEPASAPYHDQPQSSGGPNVAYAGSVKPHKGGKLLPEIMAQVDAPWHVFGGGDADLMHALRAGGTARLHGWYRTGALPALLKSNRIGVVVLPSIVPESFCLTLSECWQAGVPVICFDLGAPAERIRRQGGGWLVPLADAAEGIAHRVREWQRGALTTRIPASIATPLDAAVAQRALYAKTTVLRTP